MKIAMVAGGSGGHIYPALALAEALKEKGHEITFIGSNDRMEKDVIPQTGFDYIGLDVYTTRGGILQKIRSLLSINRAYAKCLKILAGYDAAIGFGNYISLPVMSAAVKLGLKTIIHEQNSFVGRANRMLDKKVDLIIGSYEDNLKQFNNPNIIIAGNPQADKAFHLQQDKEVLRAMGLDPDKKTLVIFMGSLGSKSVNDRLLEFFPLTKGDYQIIFATGKTHYEEMKNKIRPADHIRVYERIDGAKVMKNSTLALTRAGATTLAEICAIGIPSILIPSPFVPNNHQYYNALALSEKDAAVLLEEKDLDGEKLNEAVNSLINDDERLERMAANAKKLGNPEVLNDIIKAVENI